MTPAKLMASSLMVAQKTLAERDARIAELTVQNQIMLPKAEYFDDCMARGGLLNFRDTAKLLGMKQKVFIENLLQDKYLYRDKRGRLLPYEKRNNGYHFLFQKCYLASETGYFSSTKGTHKNPANHWK